MSAAGQAGKRLLLATAVAALAGSTVAFVVTVGAVRKLSADRVASLLLDALPERARAACQTGQPAPVHLQSGVDIDFYSGSGEPLTVGAAPFDFELSQRAAPGHGAVGNFRNRESRASFVLSDAGPCVFAQARWRYDGLASVPFVAAVGSSAATVALLLLVLVATFVVRPLLRQLRALRDSAVSAGTDHYQPAPEWPEEAGEIARALTETHGRIIDDAKRLADRSASLEWALAEIGHDVRTPLASLQLALDELAEQLPDTSLAVLRRALNDVVYLRSLTSNLRLASRLQSGDWAPPSAATTACISDIVARAVERAAAFALRRGIDLTAAVEPALVARGDDTGAEQAITNLLENAIAHSPPGTHVAVSVATHGAQLRIIVEDDGPGVVPDALPKLGTRTFRAEPERGRDARGTGLGLAITREICERSGWAVHFEHAEPTGLRAVIDAPLAHPPSPT